MRRIRVAIGLFAVSSLVLAAGCSGVDGVDGKDGEDGQSSGADIAPSVNAVSPNRAFRDRTVEVTISGYATEWTDAATIDFGPGVTVNSKKAASPTALVLEITVASDAEVGTRDVTVTEGGTTTTYTGAFAIASPLELHAQGTAAQGSVLVMTARQLDLSTPFDATTVGDGLFQPISYPNLYVEGGPGTGAIVENASPFSMTFIGLVDVTAPSGPSEWTVESGPVGDVIASSGALTIAERAPLSLSGNATGRVKAPFDSVLYKYTATADQLLTISVSAADPDAAARFVLLPSSGKMQDMLGFDASISTSARKGESFYVVYFDGAGAADYDFALTVDAVDAVAEVEPNDTCAEAQAIAFAKPVLASFKNKTDQDWFKITATAADIGKKIRLVTSPGDPETDTFVELFAADCTTSLGSADEDYHEDLTGPVLTDAGEYFVKVSPSPRYGTATPNYALTASLVD